MAVGVDITVWGEGVAHWVDWSRVARQLGLQLPPSLPLPRGEALVKLSLRTSFTPSATKFHLCFEAEADSDAGASFAGLSVAGPVRVAITCDFDSESAASAALDAFERGDRITVSGCLTAAIPFRLPGLPDWEIARVRTGDGGGRITLRLGMAIATGSTSFSVRASVEDVFTAELFMPGAPDQASWLEARVDAMTGALQMSAGGVTGEIGVAGAFRARLSKSWLVTPPIAPLEPFIRLITSQLPQHAQLSGSLSGTLFLEHDRPRFTFSCSLHDAEIHIGLHDVLGFLRDAVRGVRAPPAAEADAPPVLPEPGIGLRLRGFSFELSEEPMAAFELEGLVAGLPLPVFAGISYKKVGGLELVLGLGRRNSADASTAGDALRIPLLVPHIRREELEPLTESFGRKLSDAGRGRYDTIVGAYLTALEHAFDLLGASSPSLLAQPSAGGWLIEPTHDAQVRTSGSPVVFAMGQTTDTKEVAIGYDAGEGWRALLIKPAIQFQRVTLSLPVQNLRDVRVSGTIRFTCEGPFKEISRLPVTLGLSIDMIYASVDTEGGVAIDVPPLLPGYEGGRVVIGQFRLGFGYTKRSFALSFAGELALPRKLVDELDTSDRAGIGVRLPEKSKLALRFDLIPLVIGNVVVPLPSLQFDWDLRTSAAASTIRDRATCEPGWDGLQIVVPGRFRAGLERISFNPLLGGVVAYWNSDFGGDVQIGDENNGFTCCADNSMWAYAGDPSIWTVPLIPILSIPFFQDACVALRLGGFAFGFDLQRPLPAFSPFALFELLALVSDPLEYEVAPRGELADILRVTLANGRLTLPAPVRALFPQAGALAVQRGEMTINLADCIRLLQIIGRAIAPVIAAALELARDHSVTIQRMQGATAHLREANLRTLALSLAESVPPALRRFSIAADFAGFRGAASLAFTSRWELLRARRTPDAKPLAAETLGDSMTWNPDEMARFQPRDRSGEPLVAPFGPQAAWFSTGALSDVSEEDLLEIPPPEPELEYFERSISEGLIEWIATGEDELARRLRTFVQLGSKKSEAIWPQPIDQRPPRGSGPSASEVAAALNRALDDQKLVEFVKVEGLPKWLEERRSHKPKPDELRLFNRLLLEFVLPHLFPAEPGLICAVTVRAFLADFRLLGWVGHSGEFILITHAVANRPQLAFAGMPLRLPVALAARGTLRGRVGPAGVTGVLRIEGCAEATALIPGTLVLAIGDKGDPVTLELHGDGQFSAFGKGSIALLGDVAVLAGRLSLSHERVSASGDMSLFGLHAANGQLNADASGFAISATLHGSATRFPQELDLECRLHGQIGEGRIALAGSATLGLPWLNLPSGHARWEHTGDVSALTVEGAATWRGLAVRSAVTIRNASFDMNLVGRASHTLRDHIPGVLPNNIADVLVQLEVDATLSFGPSGVQVKLEVSWQLAVKPPGSDHFHTVLANHLAGTLDATTNLTLVDLANLTQLALPTFSLGNSGVSGPKKVRVMRHGVGEAATLHLDVDGDVVPPYIGNLERHVFAVLPDKFELSLSAPTIAAAPLVIPLKIALGWKDGGLALVLHRSDTNSIPIPIPLGG
jgi:hypothetical protein